MRDDLIHNERVKNTAQFLNNIAVAFLTTGFLTPTATMVIDYSHNGAQSLNGCGLVLLVAFSVCCSIASILCRFKSVECLGKLKEEL